MLLLLRCSHAQACTQHTIEIHTSLLQHRIIETTHAYLWLVVAEQWADGRRKRVGKLESPAWRQKPSLRPVCAGLVCCLLLYLASTAPDSVSIVRSSPLLYLVEVGVGLRLRLRLRVGVGVKVRLRSCAFPSSCRSRRRTRRQCTLDWDWGRGWG